MLEVREQVKLPFKRLLDICRDSIAHRLLRSAVTVVIITLAIAFLASIMVEGYLGRAVRDAVAVRAERHAAYARFLRNASQLEPDEALVRQFASVTPGTADFENLLRWGHFEEDAAVDFVRRSSGVRRLADFFADMPLGRRVLLVEHNQGLDVFDWLTDARNYAAFDARLERMRSLRLPGGEEAFEQFLRDWPAYRTSLARVRAGMSETIGRIQAYCGEAGLGERLAQDGNGFFDRIAGMGLALEPAEREMIREGLERQQRFDWAFGFLRKPPVRVGWNRQFQERFSPGQALESCAASPRRIAWIERRLADEGMAAGFDAERFAAVAGEYAAAKRLAARERQLVMRYGQSRELSPKTIWLITVSFLVCVVGIANAMLMSVLERFKEIATMKCLGARNGTIAFLFVTESTIIGVVGGALGMVLGFLAVLLRMTGRYRLLVFEQFPFGDITETFVVCFCCSLLLAMVAAIYPAWVASRMAPMEAMRVD